ncbi:MAG: hypothetical protein A2V83_06150 [Nitrospirae bacterium RBG_16_64_22]|nr:MAG: hypothetical protein A2V83_06150 [Nitrospirae bacterium RBG_16_64_22]
MARSGSPEERSRKYHHAAAAYAAIAVAYFLLLVWKRPPHPVEPWIVASFVAGGLLMAVVFSVLIWRGHRWLVLLLSVVYVGRVFWSALAIPRYGWVFGVVTALHVLVLAFLVRAGFDL